MRDGNFGYMLTAAFLGGQLMAWLVSRLFAKYCHYTGIDHQHWWSMGVIGWGALAAYWCLLFGGLAVVLAPSNPRAWLMLIPGMTVALVVALRFKRYWRRSRGS